MRKIVDIDVLADALLQARMVRLSLLALAAGLAVAVLVLVAEGGRELGLGWLLAFAAASVASLPAHELVHGAAFKLLCPGARVSFGVKDAFLYTSVNGAVVPRGRELAALLAPTVVVTVALATGALAASCPALAVLLCAFHLSGCVGDALIAAAILAEPACTHVQDAEFGVTLLSKE